MLCKNLPTTEIFALNCPKVAGSRLFTVIQYGSAFSSSVSRMFNASTTGKCPLKPTTLPDSASQHQLHLYRQRGHYLPSTRPPVPLSITPLRLDVEIRLLDTLISSMTSSTYLLRQQGRSNLTNYKVKPRALNKNYLCIAHVQFPSNPPPPRRTLT